MIREFAEKRGEGFYAAGIRVSMAFVVHHFRRGASPETILPKFPALGSLSTVYGAIAFYLDNLVTLDDWLIGQQQEWKNLRLPPTPSAPVRPSRQTRASVCMKVGFRADNDLDRDIVRGLLCKQPDIDFKAEPLNAIDDESVLLLASREGRLFVTHDISTIRTLFFRLREHRQLSGVTLTPQVSRLGRPLSDST